MKVYQDELGDWRVGDGVNQVSQVFPSEEAAKKYLDKRVRSQASFDRMMQYPGKIVPLEWLKENMELNKYKVVISYEMVIFAKDENQAAIIADGAINLIIEHPQTGDVIHASTEIEQEHTE